MSKSLSDTIVSAAVSGLTGVGLVVKPATKRVVTTKYGPSTIETRTLQDTVVLIDGEEWSLEFNEIRKRIELTRWNPTPEQEAAQAEARERLAAEKAAKSASDAAGDLPV